MTHEYSVEMQDYISNRISDIEIKLKSAEQKKDSEAVQFFQGQLDGLMTIRKYLTAKVDLDTQSYY